MTFFTKAQAEAAIKKVLERSRNHCQFKSAFLPRGWTCVNIEKCSKDIARALKERTDNA